MKRRAPVQGYRWICQDNTTGMYLHESSNHAALVWTSDYQKAKLFQHPAHVYAMTDMIYAPQDVEVIKITLITY